jgi:uncharacterized membrane protein
MPWINDYFLDPILKNGWFNPVNTIVYSIILVIAVYFVYKFLKKMDIHINRYFLYAILPFIFWGSSTRVLHDAAFSGVLTGPLGEFYSLPIFPTPGSYMITFLLALITLLISLVIQRFAKFPYWKTMLVIGIALCLWNVIIMPFHSVIPLLIILPITLAWTGLFFLIRKSAVHFKKKDLASLFSHANVVILGSHMLDASATFTALTFFGYAEQHVLPNLIIPVLGPASMFLLKLVVLIPVLWIIDKYAEKGDFKNFLKIVILILGLAPGLRDMIRLVAGV